MAKDAFISIRISATEKEKLKALAWDQPKVVEAPVVLIVLADMKGWQEGHPVFEKNWEEMLKAGSMQLDQREWFLNATQSLYNWSPDANLAFAAKNTGFFAMSLMYAATGLGLESHPMDGFDHVAGHDGSGETIPVGPLPSVMPRRRPHDQSCVGDPAGADQ